MRRHFTDSPPMRQTAASLPPFDALDQWGIEYPLVPEDFARLDRPASSRLSAIVSRWGVTLPKVRLVRPVGLDQWGIEYPIPDEQLAAFVKSGIGERLQAGLSSGRIRSVSQLGACAAIVAMLIAVNGPAIFVHSAPGAPTDGSAIAIVGADTAEFANLPHLTDAPPVTYPTPDPTELPLAALALVVDPGPATTPIPVPQARLFAAGLSALPTVQDARDYLVRRLGRRVDKRYGMTQAACASQIFQDESRWDPHATNKSTGAYGLPQANPASKLANWAETRAKASAGAGDNNGASLYRSWRDNPVAQAEWGVNYMVGRYGSPCAALAFRSGYWQDGVLIPGAGWY
jgi:Transglycosylase SLT domain